jgi:hypothetical protein
MKRLNTILTPPRAVYSSAVLMALTAMVLCGFMAPLIWDGAYQLCRILISQQPFFYETRFHSYLLWLPVPWLSRMTDHLGTLVFAYGLPLCLAPTASILLSWWVVRRSAPWLIVWAMLGIAGSPLPGQIFIINDSIFQQHMFWPVFLGLLGPVTPLQAAVLTALALFQLSHPVGALLLAGAATATGALAVLDAPNRRRWVIRTSLVFALTVIAVAKIFLWPDDYAQREASLHVLGVRFLEGVAGWPALAVIFTWSCAAFVWLHGRRSGPAEGGEVATKRSPGSTLARMAIICTFLAGVVLFLWAANPRLWSSAINYRRWVAPFTVPLFAFAVLEAHVPPRTVNRAALWRLRSSVVLSWGVTFAVVLTLQALGWSAMMRRLMAEVRQYPAPVVPIETIEWSRGTALDHWGTVSLVILAQGREPTKLLLDKAGTAALETTSPKIALTPWDVEPASAGGWFNYTFVLNRLPEKAPQ